MTTPPVVHPVGSSDRQYIKHAEWRQRIARQLGTSTPLAGITADSLERAIPALRRSAHPDAWIAATLCAAELERRAAKIPTVHTTGLTSSEVAWREAQARRAVAA